MADKVDEDVAADDKQPAEAAKSGGRKLAALADKLFSRKGLAILLAVSVIAHALAISYYRFRSQSRSTGVHSEISLGQFSFRSPRPIPGQVTKATFSLHLATIDEVSRLAEQRLSARTFRVEQDIEELLRRAHGTDFDDPALAELKHQLQEQIDRTLELRAIADVIITDLHTEREPEEPTSIRETAETLPWEEPSAG